MKTTWDSVLRGGVGGRGPVAESSAEAAGVTPHGASPDPRSLGLSLRLDRNTRCLAR